MDFYEAIWKGEGIGDGNDLEETILAYIHVKPEDGDWQKACSDYRSGPYIQRYSSFEDYLDNADPIETIPLNYQVISKALEKIYES